METRGALAEPRRRRADGPCLGPGHAPDGRRARARARHRPRARARDPSRRRRRVRLQGHARPRGRRGRRRGAQRLGRPVKWVEDRYENFLAAYQGRGMTADVELAFDADARMLALRARITADLGAYLFVNTAAPPHTCAMLMCGAYDIPAARGHRRRRAHRPRADRPVPRRRPARGGRVPGADRRPRRARARPRPARAAPPQRGPRVPAHDAVRLGLRLRRLRALHEPRRGAAGRTAAGAAGHA